uniref:Uncharacterized protein n=1 Tax=Sinocyclocheilus rhinocerous TaxID=307959 RepID=A0A673LGA8_9TELE
MLRKTLPCKSLIQEIHDYFCPVCCEIFKDPVVLSCSHSVCKECLQQFWRTKETQECPVCRRRSSNDHPPCNFALKNLCESLPKKRKESRSSGFEELCSLHSEKLKLFCLEDKQPVCLVCRDSQKHVNHTFRPISEVVPSYKVRQTYLTNPHLSTRSSCCSRIKHQIKQQFEKLHQFLRDEEEATITALREEEEQKKQMMEEKLEEINSLISALSRLIIKAAVDCVSSAPVILDPNTANPRLVLSDDLTSVRYSEEKQPLPDNPERFDECLCVLASEGFNSGTHCWDVEVKESSHWSVGVTTASNQRKGDEFFSTAVWSVRYDQYGLSERFGFPVKQKLECVRVCLDCDRGTVSFSDPVTNTHLHTFTTTFTDTVFPLFRNLDEKTYLRILPVKH